MGRLFKIALGLFLVGVGIVAIFSILSEDNLFAAVSEEDFVYHELTYEADEFVKFDFQFDNRDFIFRASENDEIKISYYTTEKDPVDVVENGNVLELVNDIEWYNQVFIGWDFFTNDDYYDVYVYLPTTSEYEVYLVNANGSVDIENLANFTDIFVGTSNGRITLENVVAESVDLVTSNGEVRLTSVVVTDNIAIITSNGRIYLTDVIADAISGISSNGKVIATAIDAEVISLSTSNGDIEVNLAGPKADYALNMSTSNGDMVYDGIETTSEHLNTGADKTVNLNTSNGDITVTFAD